MELNDRFGSFDEDKANEEEAEKARLERTKFGRETLAQARAFWASDVGKRLLKDQKHNLLENKSIDIKRTDLIEFERTN